MPALLQVVLTSSGDQVPDEHAGIKARILQCVQCPTDKVGDPSLSQAMISTYMF